MKNRIEEKNMKRRVKRALVPKLRFSEFWNSGEWEDQNFYDLLTDVLDFRGRTPKKLGMEWGGGNIISLSANNVKNGYIDLEAECNLGSEALYEKWMGGVSLEKNDIVFTMEAPLGNALLVPDSQKYILSQRVVAFKTKNEINNSFLIHLIRSENFQNEIEKLSTGSTAKGINQKTLKKINLRIPTARGEQQKIADCLSSVDELMATKAKKLDTLKAHKKGLMQQLFPAKGKTCPQLRFPEFREAREWKEVKLGDGSDVRDGTHDSPEFVSKGRPLVTSKNLLSTGSLDLFNVNFICEYDYEQINKRSKVNVGDILFGMIGTIGNPVLVKSEGFAIKNVALIKQKDELLNSYLVQFLQSQYAAEKFKVLNAGNSQKFIALGQIRSMFIKTPPTPKEQQKIADCLSSVDELMATEAKKLDTLKAHKKGLMQQLFPSVDAGT